ncbi:MAG: O-antigen ligase family protein [Nitratireductor sp.]
MENRNSIAGRNAHWLWPDRANLRRANRYVLPALLLGYPVLGSINSLAAVILMLTGLLILVFLRPKQEFSREAILVAGAMAAFFCAEALSAIVNWRGISSLREILENLTFLGFLPFVALITRGRHSLLAALASFAPIAAMPGFALAGWQVWAMDIRAQGMAGNAAIFAVSMSVVYAFTLVSVMRRNSFLPRFTNFLGAACAAGAIILSGTRSLWPVIIVFPLIFAMLPGGTMLRGARQGLTAGIAVAVVSVAILLAGPGKQRIEEIFTDISAAGNDQMMTSLGKRIVVWKTAIATIPERPILGFGPDSPQIIMAERSAAHGGTVVAFSHFHNFILTEMVRAGLTGTLCIFAILLAPLIALRHAGKDETAALAGRALTSALVAFVMSGSTNILFDHDIMDSLFVVVIATLVVLAVPREAIGRRVT